MMVGKLVLHTRFHHSSIFLNCLLLLCSVRLNAGNIFIHDENGEIEEFSDHEWLFGPHISVIGMEGVIVNADPPNACVPISAPPVANFTGSQLNWFVLVNGISCDYDTKVLNSQLAGYSAAIIYDSEASNADILKHQLDYIPDIPAVIITVPDASTIQDNFLYTVSKRFKALIVPYGSSNIMKLLNTFTYCGGILLFIVGFLTLTRSVKRRCLIGCNRSDTQFLRKLQISQYQAGDPFETCAICLENFNMNEKLRILPCSHGFHVKCIDPWITNHQKTCPVCKQTVCAGQEKHGYPNTETTPLISNTSRPLNGIGYNTVIL